MIMSRRLTKEELDAQFEQFLKESVSDDSVDLGAADKQPHSKSNQKPRVRQDEALSAGGSAAARLESQISLRKSESIQEEDEEAEGIHSKEEDLVLRDNKDTEGSATVSAVYMSAVGLDTLEEEEEKARFFAQLEAGASSTIDYSKLNRELDSTRSTPANNYRNVEEAEEPVERGGSDDHSKARGTISPAFTGSPHYSEDFEDDEDVKVPLEETSTTASVLARGQSYVQSGASELEALQEAYRQVHVVEDSDDRGHHTSSLEVRWSINRPLSPSSPPQRAQQSLQPVSTSESELPTAEELMRLLRPEAAQIRGFTLQPVSVVEPNHEKTSRGLERAFPDEAQHPAAAAINGAEESTSHPISAAHPPNKDLICSIRAEVDKLMQDHTKSSSLTSSHTGKTKKHPASRGSLTSPSCTSSMRQATPAPVRGKRLDGRMAVTSRSSGISRGSATPAKTRSAVSSQCPHRANHEDCWDCTEPGVTVRNELVASVQSLVAVLQQQIDATKHQDSAQEVRETRLEQHLPQIRTGHDSSVLEELRTQLAQKERELQMMKAGAEELSSLRQQNYLLQSKLRSAEEASQKKRWVEAADVAADEKFQQIDKEIKEQEALIKGYQQENEKLYLQMKAQQAKSKANEEAMFKENQRLLNELAATREQLHKTSRPVGSICLTDHTPRIADLLAQINSLQRNEAKMSADVHKLKQEKQALEVDLQLINKERDLAEARATSTSGNQTFEMRVLEDRHQEEVTALKKKLQWFAEKQEMLDRDAGRLKAATAEIHQLREQVEKLKQEVGKRNSWQRKARDKFVDLKRMKDLERQVKELEQILRSRNPNSLPALIYAAATSASYKDAGKMSSSSQITALLERRIQRLEAELENHDEEAKRSLQVMEQQFHRVKLRYEQQICELQQQLQRKQQVEAAAGSQSSVVQALEEELYRVKQSHKQKEKSLHEQIESLQQQLKQKALLSPGRHQRQAEAAFGVRLERLNQELAKKTRTIQELKKERRNMPSAPNTRAERRSTESKHQQPGLLTAGGETFPAAPCEKTYQPTVFTGSHISEVLQENEALKKQVQLVLLQSEQEKEALKADAAQAKQQLSRLTEEFEEQLSTTKAEHFRVLDHLRATHALEHSDSKVAELTNKLSTQEIMMNHLDKQLKEMQGCKEALKISRRREDALQTQLTKLLQELKEAKEASSSEVKLLCTLERKILNMELRHQHREKELQQVLGGAWQTPGDDLQSELEHWRRLAQDKSREMDAFRLELDSILDILRHLQRQGAVLPTPELAIPQRS
ncbi:centrosomal protein of 162 kDa isoform X1 [Simochromis diagramma]|uniref:centrosomal protein of 162 kDa isoform X1 n=1 Tax=Simochromis diagramma TaxID=43689 RepID=UPI001A7EAB50|nr:centrosomal protein of 162 kDa isoform X1 [Simochromis diagramma]XP_039864355.1 centrosomal protein of 162 kDa isoform X1 [Simochromis diagramma]